MISRNQKLRHFAGLCGLVSAVPQLCLAELDPKAGLHIQAEEVEIDEAAGLSTYRGGVVIRQERVRLTAAQVELRFDADGVETVVATGEPVRYQEISAEASGLTAVGKQLEYTAASQQIRLYGNARVEREGNVLSGNMIVYSLKDKTARAEGPTGKPRVGTTLVPDAEIFR